MLHIDVDIVIDPSSIIGLTLLVSFFLKIGIACSLP